jgi:hypothetical protein
MEYNPYEESLVPLFDPDKPRATFTADEDFLLAIGDDVVFEPDFDLDAGSEE